MRVHTHFLFPVLAFIALVSGVFYGIVEGDVSARTEASAQPNFIFIVADDLSRLDYTRENIPNVYRYLVDQGTTFDNFIMTTPVCGPSRASMLTGEYAHNHGVLFCEPDTTSKYKFDVYYKKGFADNDAGAAMQSLGYYTAMVGKYINSYGVRGVMIAAFDALGHDDYLPKGWNEFLVPLTTDYYDWSAVDNGHSVTYGDGADNYKDDVEARRFMQSIQDAHDAGQPFLGYYWPGAPHQPDTATSSMNASRHDGLFSTAKVARTPDYNEADMSDKPEILQPLALLTTARQNRLDRNYANRLQSLQAVDEAVADIIAQLEALGELDKTYIFFLSDNGMLLGHHRLTSKLVPYDLSTRAPLIVRGPGVASGVIRNELTGTVDLFPTMLDLLNLPVTDNVDGQSFKQLLSAGNPVPDPNWRSTILAEDWVTENQIGNNGPFSILVQYSMLRGATFEYIKWYNGEHEYYDLSTDPYELQNSYSALSASTTNELEAQLTALASCKGLSCHQWGATSTSPYPIMPYVQHNAIGSGVDRGVNQMPAHNPVIAVTAPYPGATISPGTTVSIQWDPTSLASPIDTLRIRLDSGQYGSTVLSDAATNTGDFSWQAPAHLATGTRYRLFLQSVSRPEIAQNVGPLTVGPPPDPEEFSFSYPTALTAFHIGDKVPVTWAATTSQTRSVSLFYRATTSPMVLIQSDIPFTARSYSWTISSATPPSILRLYLVSDQTNKQATTSPFSIISPTAIPSLTITAPETGTSFNASTTLPLTWSATNFGSLDTVRIYYVRNPDVPVTWITTSTPALSGYFKWSVPPALSLGAGYSISIVNVASSTIRSSTSKLTALPHPTLAFTAPVQGNTYPKNSALKFSWTQTDLLFTDRVRISYTPAGYPSGWVSTSTSAQSGEYVWNIPESLPAGSYHFSMALIRDNSIYTFVNNVKIQ